jgi:type IV pilus assembly protein PilQ
VDTLIALEEKLDVPEKQVMIEMRLVDMGKTLLRQLGINWALTQPGYEFPTDKTNAFSPFSKPYDGLLGPNPMTWQWGQSVSFLGEDFNFDLFASAYENRGLVSVLANPKVITLNNITAKIDIIEEIPYTDTVIGSGGAQTVKAEFKESGIKMEVTPNITNNGYIRMKLKPEQKIFRGMDQITQRLPVIDKRSAETNVIIRDEETVVLGGLRQDTKSNTDTGTPWFMDIPVLGWLFKKNSIESRELELVMFVTPHIIKEPSLTEVEKLEYQQIDTGWNLPEEFFAEKEEEK